MSIIQTNGRGDSVKHLAGIRYSLYLLLGLVACVQGVHADSDMSIKRHYVYAPGVEVDSTEGEGTESNDAVVPEASSQFSKEFYEKKYSARPYPIRRTGINPHAPFLGIGPRRDFDDVIRSSVTFDPIEDSLLNIDTTKKLHIKKIGKIDIDPETQSLVGTGGVDIELDSATFKSNSAILALDGHEIQAEGDVHIYTDVSEVRADKLHIKRTVYEDEEDAKLIDRPARPLLPSDFMFAEDGQKYQGTIEAHQLEIYERDKFFKAEYLQFDTQTNTGIIKNSRGRSGLFYFSADSVEVTGPQSIVAQNLWVTTCDNPKPHYKIRIRNAVVEDGKISSGKRARFQFRKWAIPFYVPRISGLGEGIDKGDHLGFDIDVGNESDLGYYLNIGQWYQYSPNVDVAYRFFPTSRNGIGGGIDVEYNFMDDPASRLFHSSGEINSLYTTRDEGYHHWYHRAEVDDDTLVLAQWEQWYNPEFLKEFYEDEYEDRTGPRSFVNVTHLGDGYIFSGTASKATHDFTNETEKLPEASLHLLERHLGKQLYLTMDSYAGYYHREPEDFYSQRYSHVARLSYDWNIKQGLNIIPFVEGAATHYSKALHDGESDALYSGMAGVTTQARFQRAYGGLGKFEGFKHIVVPSVSYITQETSSMDIENVPRFDDVDDRPVRDRVETKLDQILLGRNSVNGDTWRVAQLTLYHGYDLENESSETHDIEIDMQLRPRPWWGFRTLSERFRVYDNPGVPGNDYTRLTNYLFFNNSQYENTWSARVGYIETEVDDMTIEQNVLYGAGYKLSEAWSVSADHQYSLDEDDLVRQRYELRRRLHMWEMGFLVRDRNGSTDFNVTFSLLGINGTDIKF